MIYVFMNDKERRAVKEFEKEYKAQKEKEYKAQKDRQAADQWLKENPETPSSRSTTK
jgi:hypothetical protein